MLTTRTAPSRPHAIVIGAACGIGYQLARGCAERGFDLLITADAPDVEDAAQALRELGVAVEALQADAATLQGVEQIHTANRGRRIDALLVHAAPRRAADAAAAHDADDHITGTLYLLHKLGGDIARPPSGRILVTGSLPGFVPAFVDAYSLGLRNQIKDCGAAITCVVPGATENGFYVRTDRTDTQVLYVTHDDPTAVASAGLEALLREPDDPSSPDWQAPPDTWPRSHPIARAERPGTYARI